MQTLLLALAGYLATHSGIPYSPGYVPSLTGSSMTNLSLSSSRSSKNGSVAGGYDFVYYALPCWKVISQQVHL
jgi:hypothetical protein